MATLAQPTIDKFGLWPHCGLCSARKRNVQLNNNNKIGKTHRTSINDFSTDFYMLSFSYKSKKKKTHRRQEKTNKS